MAIADGAGPTSQQQTPPGASPSTLAGGDDSQPTSAQSSGDPQQDPDAGMAKVVQQIREMKVAALDLARQFPAAAPSFRKISDELSNATRSIIANPGSPEPPTPRQNG